MTKRQFSQYLNHWMPVFKLFLPLINYSREFPFIWCTLRYNITFESNWEAAREVLLNAMRSEVKITDTARRAKEYFEEMSASFSIKVDPTDPVVRCWTSGVGVELTARFLTHPRRRSHLIDVVNLKVLREITQSDDIRFAYWTIRSIATPPAGMVTPQHQQDALERASTVDEKVA